MLEKSRHIFIFDLLSAGLVMLKCLNLPKYKLFVRIKKIADIHVSFECFISYSEVF